MGIASLIMPNYLSKFFLQHTVYYWKNTFFQVLFYYGIYGIFVMHSWSFYTLLRWLTWWFCVKYIWLCNCNLTMFLSEIKFYHYHYMSYIRMHPLFQKLTSLFDLKSSKNIFGYRYPAVLLPFYEGLFLEVWYSFYSFLC